MLSEIDIRQGRELLHDRLHYKIVTARTTDVTTSHVTEKILGYHGSRGPGSIIKLVEPII